MRKRNLLLIGMTTAALAGCGAPSQPAPEPGTASTLSADVIPYDTTTFLTNREPVLPPNGGCDKVDVTLLAKIGVQLGKYNKPDGDSTQHSCSIYTDSETLKIGSAPKPFADYWRSRASETTDPAATSSQGTFRRYILNDRYYAVQYTYENSYSSADEKECRMAVDTGSPNALTLDLSQKGSSSREQTCTATEQYATKLLGIIDPKGGSRVG